MSAKQMRTIYVLKVRQDDSSPWSEPTYYRTKKERDDTERLNRILGGIRTHSYNEKKTPEELEEIFD